MADDLVPSDERISREALDRIIHRAAELQAAGREIGEHLTEREVMELGEEVGIPAQHLQRALLEERTRAVVTRDNSFLVKLAGPRRVKADRAVPGERPRVEEALGHWMTEVELLAVKRRYSAGTSWEPRKDWITAMKRGMGLSGRRYILYRAREIVGQVEALETGWCHVTLIADVSNARSRRVGGGTAFLGSGAAMTTVAVVLGVATAVAVIPAIAGLAGGWAIARGNRPQVERVHVALEQVLDRLERGEIDAPKALPKSQPEDFVKRITAEIKDIGKNWGR
jgi:hypothetical protein